MKKRIPTIFMAVFLATLFIVGNTSAQENIPLKAWAASGDELFFKGAKRVPFLKEAAKTVDPKTKIGIKMKGYMFDDARGPIPDYTRLNLKKFAIISVTTGDYSAYKSEGANKEWKITLSLKDAAIDSIHQKFYRESVAAIQADLKKQGAACLSVDDVYNQVKSDPELAAWEPESGGLSFLSGKKSGGTEHITWHCFSENPVIGRTNFETEVIPADAKGFNSYGKLAKSLGVDAVILLTTLLDFDAKGNLVISSLTMHIYGPNPTPKMDKKYIGFNGTGYNEGQLYSQVVVPGNGATLAFKGKERKEKDASGKKVTVVDGQNFNIDGFGKITSRILGESLAWIELQRKIQLEIKKD